MIYSWILSLRLATMRNARLITFETAQSIPKNQQ